MDDWRSARSDPMEAQSFERSVRIPFLDPATDDPESMAAIQRDASHLETDRAWVAEAGQALRRELLHIQHGLGPSRRAGRGMPSYSDGRCECGRCPPHSSPPRPVAPDDGQDADADARVRGEAVAGLIASESIIYGRFRIRSRHRQRGPDDRQPRVEVLHCPPDCDIYLVDRDEAGKLHYRGFMIANAAPGPARLRRSADMWEDLLADRPEQRGGDHPQPCFAACDDGYVIYREPTKGAFSAWSGFGSGSTNYLARRPRWRRRSGTSCWTSISRGRSTLTAARWMSP